MKPNVFTTTYNIDEASWSHLSDDADFMEHVRNHLGHQLADRIFQECQSGEKIVSVGNTYVKEIPELCQVEIKENVSIEDLIRCHNCEHWRTLEDRNIAENGQCFGFKYALITPRNGFCFKGIKNHETY